MSTASVTQRSSFWDGWQTVGIVLAAILAFYAVVFVLSIALVWALLLAGPFLLLVVLWLVFRRKPNRVRAPPGGV